MTKKKRQRNKLQKPVEKPKKNFLRGLTFSLGLGLFSVGGVYLARQNENKTSPIVYDSSVVGQYLKDPRVTQQITKLSNEFESAEPELISFVQNNLEKVVKMTEVDFEVSGYIRREKSGLVFEESRYNSDARRYLDEAIRGNFRNRDSLINMIVRSDGNFYGDKESDERLVVLLRIMSEHQKYSQLPESQKKDTDSLSSPYFKKGKMSVKDLGKLNLDAKDIFGEVLRRLKNVSMTTADEAFFDKNAFARFHTHQKDDILYPPSPQDESNTYFAGPGVLFTQTKDTLHVYLLNKGKSKEVLAKKIK